MKRVLISLLGMLMSTHLLAGELDSRSQLTLFINDYHHRMQLDNARVLEHSEIPFVCGIVPVQMTYEDSRGEQHTIHYRVMDNGCLAG
ncbi:hypothetical protein D3C76_266810 [compost metagenome]